MNGPEEFIPYFLGGAGFSVISHISRHLLIRRAMGRVLTDSRNSKKPSSIGVPLTVVHPDVDKEYFQATSRFTTLLPIGFALLGIAGVVFGSITGNSNLVAISAAPAISHTIEMGIRLAR